MQQDRCQPAARGAEVRGAGVGDGGQRGGEVGPRVAPPAAASVAPSSRR